MSKFGSRINEAVANCSGAMEQRPFKNNGQNLKSQTSRGNLMIKEI
jgi:hypothetical protein